MSPRRWQNIAKYLFDMSKLIWGVAVVTHLVNKDPFNLIVIALGSSGGLVFFIAAVRFDKKGETK